MNSIKQEMLSLVKQVNNEIPEDTSVNLLNGGYIDSFDIANIVPALEDYFQIDIPPEEIVPENFTSLDSMTDMVQRHGTWEKE